MDVIPLNASLIKGSHGSVHTPKEYHPVLITNRTLLEDAGVDPQHIKATDVYDVIWKALHS